MSTYTNVNVNDFLKNSGEKMIGICRNTKYRNGCPCNEENTVLRKYFGVWLCRFCYTTAEARGYHCDEVKSELPLAEIIGFFEKCEHSLPPNSGKQIYIHHVLEKLGKAEEKYFLIRENRDLWKEEAEILQREKKTLEGVIGRLSDEYYCDSCRKSGRECDPIDCLGNPIRVNLERRARRRKRYC